METKTTERTQPTKGVTHRVSGRSKALLRKCRTNVGRSQDERDGPNPVKYRWVQNFSKHPNMTHVILENGFDEKYISFPTPPTFQDFLKAVRTIEPNRRFQILESWETT